jgi:hypothetical protein
MSWWVYLRNEDGFCCEIEPRHKEGGTYVLGGTNRAELNITYNYSPFYACLDEEKGLEFIDGKKAEDCISRLEKAVSILGVETDSDYWKATAGNAGLALAILLSCARQHPGAVFKVS